jgi:hypothetical protein
MKFIETEFIHDKQKDHHANSNPDAESENINERKDFILPEISPRDFEIIF